MVLQLKDWHIQRGKIVNIGAMDFSLNAGEIVSLMGPSGCGKSTWLMTLLGYEELGLTVKGDRYQEGKRLTPNAVPFKALYIPQSLPFNPNWQVESFLCRLPWGNDSILNTLFPVRSTRIKRVRAVLKELGLEGRERATVAELSGGEAQRAAVAQILLLSPKILIGDEFVSGLDPGMATWILDHCRESLGNSGGAAILALHDVQTALKISERILIIWPPTIDTQPWEIKRGTSAWQGNVLYTILCLARYAKDLPPNNAICHLVKYLQTWIQDERALQQFFDKCADDSIVMITNEGTIIPTDRAIQTVIPSDNLSNHWTNISPVRMQKNSQVQIGVSIPRNNKTALTVLINVEIRG